MTNSYLSTLRRVGIVVIIIGVLDIGYMAYCISTEQSYSSSLNIFAIVAGIFLMRGNLTAARVISWFTAFFLAAFIIGIVIIAPTFQPLGLSITQIRLNPYSFIISAFISVVLLCVLFWIYRELRSPIVIKALSDKQKSVKAPKSAFIAGGCLVLIIVIMMNLTLNGASSKKAVLLAKEKLGAQYQYNVKEMRWAGDHVWANVTAYNKTEIKSIEVEWDK